MLANEPTRVFLVAGVMVTAILVAPAPLEAQQSGMIFGACLYTGSTDYFRWWEPPGQVHMPVTRCADTSLGLSYGLIDWDQQLNWAGGEHYHEGAAATALRNQNWDPFDPLVPEDHYERLGHWQTSHGSDPAYRTRGLVRYDEDTFLLLSSQRGRTDNANGLRPPSIFQIEYRTGEATDEQYYDFADPVPQKYYLMRAAPWPFGWQETSYQWGPRPDDALPEGSTVDWTWTGGALTGRLQIADSTQVSVQWRWDQLPEKPLLNYLTFDVDWNFKYVEDAYGGTHTLGNIADGSLYWTDYGYVNDSSIIDLAVFHGENENIVYAAQFEGRIYKLVGAKNLGYRRLAGQAAAGAAVVGFNNAEPILDPETAVYPTDFDSGYPTVGDDPNQPHGAGMTTTELFNEDPGSPGDPIVTGRHYSGLAVDRGGRVYAISEQLVDTQTGVAVEPLFIGTAGDVWNADPAVPSGYSLRDDSEPFDGVTINVGDKIILLDGTGVNRDPIFSIVAIASTDKVELDQDPGDSGGTLDVEYRVYPAENADPRGLSPGVWTSEAFVDVYQPDGALDTTIDLNQLVLRDDTTVLGDIMSFGPSGEISGFVVQGDLEVDPNLIYGVNFPELLGGPLTAPPQDVTRLWICGTAGDGDPDTHDGLGLLVVDVAVNGDGTVAQASFVGAIDDKEAPLGTFYTTYEWEGEDYTTLGFLHFDMWQNFSDVEFDGHGSMVYMGGRGNNDNRYFGTTPGEVARAVEKMEDEALLNQDGIVNLAGFQMYMNIYGYGTDFGIAFDNAPLTNSGCLYPLLGDIDADGDVDLDDLAALVAAMNGPGQPPGNPNADLDDDGDCDLKDYGGFAAAYALP